MVTANSEWADAFSHFHFVVFDQEKKFVWRGAAIKIKGFYRNKIMQKLFISNVKWQIVQKINTKIKTLTVYLQSPFKFVIFHMPRIMLKILSTCIGFESLLNAIIKTNKNESEWTKMKNLQGYLSYY